MPAPTSAPAPAAAGAEPDLALPAEPTDPGALARLLLLETRGPHDPGYDRSQSLAAMRLMRRVVENRLAAPARYGARGARNEQDIVRLGNQFAGFRDYPTLPGPLTAKLARLLSATRTDPKVARFVGDAITVATGAASTPASPDVTGWRTVGSGSPGPGFRFVASLQGNDFYATAPVPPVPARHRPPGPFRPHRATRRR